jgi:hypothetical protein
MALKYAATHFQRFWQGSQALPLKVWKPIHIKDFIITKGN